MRFQVVEAFDVPRRGGLVALGTLIGPNEPELLQFVDELTGEPLRLLGVDFATPRTRRAGQTVFVLDRADAVYAARGRTWLAVHRSEL